MPWPSDTEPENKLHEALHIVEETRGYEQAIAIMQQELARLRVVSDFKARQQKLLPPPPDTAASPAADVNTALVDALGFYGEEANYDVPKTGRDRRSAIAKDGGQMARNTLAALAEESE